MKTSMDCVGVSQKQEPVLTGELRVLDPGVLVNALGDHIADIYLKDRRVAAEARSKGRMGRPKKLF